MIAGIGIDRIAIHRVEQSIQRFGERFVHRVYTEAEYAQALKKGRVARRLAMLFAAKEAASKALGTGFRQGMSMRDIEILHQPIGKPEIFLHGAAVRIASQAGVASMHVSLTDDEGVAMAMVIAERA